MRHLGHLSNSALAVLFLALTGCDSETSAPADSGTAGTSAGSSGGGGTGGTGATSGAGGGGGMGGGGTGCASVVCTTDACPAETRPELLPGDCCPTCIPGEPDEALCNTARLRLPVVVSNEAGPEAFSCDDDDDCGIAFLTTLCSVDCGRAANVSHVDELQQLAAAYAAEHCNPCVPAAVDCPDVEWTYVCTEGRCGLR